MTTKHLTEQLLSDAKSRGLEFAESVEPMDAIGKTVCAFLNSTGGVVILGVDPQQGKPNGLATKAQCKPLEEFLRRTITPKVLYDVSFDKTADGNVITVSVPAGLDRPYVWEGAVYIRNGTKTQAANASVLREMVEISQSTKRWERRPASGLEIIGLDRELLSQTVRRAQEGRGLQINNPKDPVSVLTQLSLLRSGQLTNAADVLFGKKVAQRHPQTRLRAVCYATDRANNFLDEQLYEGPAFQLLENAMTFLKRHVAIAAEFHPGRLTRESKPDYPFNSLREALVNALVHRDYAAFSGGVSVSIYADRVEIWNTGRLPRGISPRDLMLPSHSSILVNPDIAHVFYLYELMERVGRGTYQIAQECRDFGMRPPEWKNVGSGVRLTMFTAKSGAPTIDLNVRQKKLLDALKPGEEIRVSEYLDRFGHEITDRQARRDLTELESAGYFVRHGAGPKTSYERTEKME